MTHRYFQPLTAGLLAVLLVAAAPAAQPPAAQPPAAKGPALEVTYIGNEGFLLAAGGRKVLIDALTAGDLPDYVLLPPDLRARLEGAEPPFDGVELVLATHFHADHFGPRAVARYLAANPRAVFVSTPQAVARLRGTLGASQDLMGRVRAVLPEEGGRLAIPELGVTALHLHHGRDRDPPVQNLGFLIEMGGLRVLHVGDTEATPAEFAPHGLVREGIDLGLIPSWILLRSPWKGAVEEAIRPRRLVAMHLPPAWSDRVSAWGRRFFRDEVAQLRKAYPQAVIFEQPMETRRFEPP